MIHLFRSFRLAILLLTAILLVGGPGVRAEPPGTAQFFYKNGDSPIVFLGDSITQQQMYTTLVEAYVLTRFPAWNVTFRNIGWGGDTSWFALRGGLSNGLTRDVLPLYPSAITIAYGMNDAAHRQANYQLYLDSCVTLVQACKARGARVALLTSTPKEGYKAGAPGGDAYNETLQQYSTGLASVAKNQDVPYVDLLTPFLNAITTGRQNGVLGAAGEPRLTSDNIHPTWAGHLVMAANLLKSFKAPSLVSGVELDAGTRQVVAAQNCRVKATFGSALTFTRTDGALPWPIPAEAALAFRLPDFNPIDDLSRYELKVSNLATGHYNIWIDKRQIGTFTADELEAGLNLSSQAGPITDQAMAVLDKILQKNATFSMRWRTVQVAWPDGAAKDAELARLDAAIAVQERDINALRQPIAHTWRIVPAPLTIVTPANGSVLTAAPAKATGTTGALSGDTRLRAVLRCFRYGDATHPAGYWNGTAFVPRTNANAAALERPVRLAGDLWSAVLPAGSMAPGRYTMQVIIYYAHRGTITSPWAAFTILARDAVRPSVSITYPLDGSILRSLTSIGGKVMDNAGGSGMASVQVEVLHPSDNLWWTGSVWGARSTLPATLKTSGSWSKTTGLPMGAYLPDGPYTLSAIAMDRAGNRVSSSVNVTIDSHPPAVAFTTPLAGAFVPSLNSISGTATDEAQLASVQLTIQRNSDGLFWTGTTWGTRTSLSASISAGRIWNYALPTDAKLTDGLYTLGALAKDAAGNTRQSSVQAYLDTIPPLITLNTPKAGAVLTNADLGILNGTVADSGSGLDRVTIQLQRQSDGLFWTGTAWGEAADLAARLQDEGWSKNDELPSGADLMDGTYALFAIAVDRAGNRADAKGMVNIDTHSPAVTFTTPLSGSFVPALNLISGTATDEAQLAGVQLTLQRDSDGLFWTGTTWGTRTLLAVNIGTNGVWNYSLPSNTSLTDGLYTLEAVAKDMAGNQGKSKVQVSLDATPPSITLSVLTDGTVLTSADLGTLSGTVTDNGSGVERVALQLQRQSDGLFWTGTMWGDATDLAVSLQDGNWNKADELPSGADLPNDGYQIIIKATDKAGNSQSVTSTFTVAVQQDLPTEPEA